MVVSTRPHPVALTIAGSDSSAGAGIQADLKAFSATGVHGTSVITCITAQNTRGIHKLEPVSIDMIKAQLDSVLVDLRPVTIKTGMLYSAEIVDLVADTLSDYQERSKNDVAIRLVVDPVMTATTGEQLTNTNEAIDNYILALKNKLFPITTVLTPNLPETSALLGWDVLSRDDILKACSELQRSGSEYVLIKGGHAKTRGLKANDVTSDTSIDVLYNGIAESYHTYEGERSAKEVHGTGCTFASLIAGFLAKGFEVPAAVSQAKDLISTGIMNSYAVGSGANLVNTFPEEATRFDPERARVFTQVTNAAFELTKLLTPKLVPEVGINIGYALPYAKMEHDVCALTGRLVRVGERISHLGGAKFGASKHVARIILATMKTDPKMRSAMNIKYRPETIKICNELNFSIGTFDRGNEPEGGSSMDWGTRAAIDVFGSVPDIIYDTGGLGKEPMIRILGTEPKKVLEKINRILDNLD